MSKNFLKVPPRVAGRGAEGAAPQRLPAPGGRTQHRPHLGGQRQAGVRRPHHQVLGYIEDQSQSTELTSVGSGSGSWIRILLFSSLTFKMPAKN
jgi:hypothetical protein